MHNINAFHLETEGEEMARGGKRTGAGRPKGTGKFGEATKAVRVPVSLINTIMKFIERKGMTYPLYNNKIAAEHPVPVDEPEAEQLDIGEFLFKHSSAVFLFKANGDSMIGAGISPNDTLIVDKSLFPRNGDIVIVSYKGEFIVRRLFKKDGIVELLAENDKFDPIPIEDEDKLIWGVVRHVIHPV